MNLLDFLKNGEQQIATQNLLKDKASITLLQVKKDAILKEHQSTTNAMLILLSGKVNYEEKERKVNLAAPNDFVKIPTHMTHRLVGLEDAVLLLVQ